MEKTLKYYCIYLRFDNEKFKHIKFKHIKFKHIKFKHIKMQSNCDVILFSINYYYYVKNKMLLYKECKIKLFLINFILQFIYLINDI